MLKTFESHGDSRLVCVTSVGLRAAPAGGVIFKTLRTPQDLGPGGRWYRYAQSKLANVLYGGELARRYPSISVANVHPGVIKTDLVQTLGFADKMLVLGTNIGKMKTVEQGTQNQLWAATVDKEDLQSNDYYEPIRLIGTPSTYSQDRRLAAELWEWTQNQLEGNNLEASPK